MPLGEVQELLDYVTLTAAVDEFRYADLGIANFLFPGQAKRTNGGDSFRYDIRKASRDTAAPKSPGAPSKRVALVPKGTKAGRCIHVAEHKMLDGDRMANVRRMGSREREQLQAYVAAEQLDLSRRRARLRELAGAAMLIGTLSIDEDDVKADVDYDIDNTHKPTASVSWATSTTDIVTDIRTWKRLVSQDSGYTPAHALCNEGVMSYLMANDVVKEFMGEGVYKAQVGQAGYITQLCGLTIHVFDHGYIPSGGSFTRYVADDKFVIVPTPEPSWCQVLEGSTYIKNLGAEALVEVFGPFSNAVIEADPAGYKLIVGDTFIPALYVPDAVVYADVTP